ncbi:aerotaxis receptor [Oxalobacteraceae bacterium GrIS 2.11]
MRKNLPVTNVEIALSEHQSIVSITNLKGIITYANPYFIEVSGYSAEELIGAPHNILRHPDMPPEGFRDLWDTVKQGNVWNGMVKNRCKNGDYYWVMANVTPVIENGQPVGYMSVRIKPTRDQVAAAVQLYAEMNIGNPRSLALCEGRLVKSGWRGKMLRLFQPSLKQRVRISCTAQLIIMALLNLGIWQAQGLGASMALVLHLVTVGGIAFTLWFWYFLETGIINPLHQAMIATQTMTGGDLTGKLDTDRNDDMGRFLRALRQLNINLHSVISDIRSNFERMQSATREIADGNMDLSGRTEAQAASLEETASSMEQLAATVENNARHALAANEMANKASSVAQSGGDIVEKVISTIGEINHSSQKIVDIIGIIDGIAFQTNILALNAAVEAARAGEQGRGFAVVASEVRSLAQRSATAAQEIKQLINTSVNNVDAGTVLANNAGNTMSEIIASVQKVNGIMGEISQASREQSMGISQVNQAVTQMDDVTQQNAALVEEAAAATKSLEQQASTLMQALSVFKLDNQRSKFATGRTNPRKLALHDQAD